MIYFDNSSLKLEVLKLLDSDVDQELASKTLNKYWNGLLPFVIESHEPFTSYTLCDQIDFGQFDEALSEIKSIPPPLLLYLQRCCLDLATDVDSLSTVHRLLGENNQLATYVIEHNDHVETPLVRAIARNSTKIAETLILAGINVNQGDTESPLTLASSQGNLKLVQLLLSAGADVNYKRSGCVKTPLIRACQNGHLQVVKTLIRSGADVRLTDYYYHYPLEFAIQSGNLDIVQEIKNAISLIPSNNSQSH